MGEENLISIVIPAYNRPDYLKRCLASVKLQEGSNFEVIVVDDNSSENLKFANKSCDIFIRNEVNLGASCSRNVGFLKSSGELILFLDSDSELRPNTLKQLSENFQNDPSIAALGGSGPPDESGQDVKHILGKSYDYFGRSKKTYYSQADNGPAGGIYDCDHLESAFLAVRRDVFIETGGFDPYWRYMGEDRDLCLSVKALGKRVVASLNTRAIHRGLHSHTPEDPEAFRGFLLRRYLQVAIKREGIWGGIRWMIGNHRESFKRSRFADLLAQFREHGALTTRKNMNFLDLSEMDSYYSKEAARQLNDKLPFPVPPQLPAPRNIVLFATAKCNARCSHCFASWLNSGIQDISKTDILKIRDSLIEPTSISLTGGEVFLRDDLEEILDALMGSPKIASIKLLSNGFLPEKIESICRSVLQNHDKRLNLQLSLDGLSDTHNTVRKMPGGFEKVIDTCERAKRLASEYGNFSWIIAITLMRQNLSETAELAQFLGHKQFPSKLSLVRGNSFSTFGVPHEILNHEYEPRDGVAPDIVEVENLLAKINLENPAYFNDYQKLKLETMLSTLKHRKRQSPCYAGYKDAVVFSDGNIAICEQVKPFGNLSEWGFDISKAWNSKKAWEHRIKLAECSCIHGCNIATSARSPVKS
jgi:glycosyltransferase involved in cell wall biosynthesis/MoaA/NifB/PqqE/SkfB family radical SAM enzyme